MTRIDQHLRLKGKRALAITATVLILLATINFSSTVVHASKGAGLMSTMIDRLPDSTRNSAQNTFQGALKDTGKAVDSLKLDQARLDRQNDPLLPGRDLEFERILKQRQQRLPVPESRQDDSFVQGAGEIKRKAVSLLVQMGIMESEKTNTIRRPVDHTVISVDKSPTIALNNRAEKIAKQRASEPAARNKIEKAAGDAGRVAENENQGYVMRMQVDKNVRSSLALDMLAEATARKILTEEAKASLLPVKGMLSAKFESGKDGIAAIGYDRKGGTSYGKYQIASRVGMMKLFLNFLDDKNPEWAKRLRTAGPANTRSRWGGMPSEWKKIAAEAPEKFDNLQDEFIMQTNYEPAVAGIEAKTNLHVSELSPAIKEVLWSTAVQHGPRGASNIFARAVKMADSSRSQEFDKTLIEKVYEVRKRNFGGSSRRVRRAVQSRLNMEKDMALEMLNEDGNA